MSPTTARGKRPVFPVGLLVAGRRCLVAGGGKVALRKVRSLLDAQADVTVVSPDLHPELAELVQVGTVQHTARPFQPDDLQDCFLAFAATDDPDVNRTLLECCRKLGVCGCSVDKAWVDGDFVSPASFRKGDLTVAVSTGGKSCRRSRMIKESLARHVEMVETAGLIVVGTSHNVLPLREREPFHLTGRRLDDVGDMIMQVWGVHEFALLNTCNRIELIAVVTQSTSAERVLKRILQLDGLDEAGYYIKRDHEAFSHVAILISGLLSQTPGENHIVAQVKDSVAHATARGWASGMLQQWLSSALHMSKHIRQETAPLLHHQEIEDLCFQYLAAELPDWPSRRVLVIGAGVIGTGIARTLASEQRPVTWCYHRTRPELPPGLNGNVTLCDMNALRENLATTDVVVCATASEGHVLHMGHAPFFDQERDTVIVDLAMPRNIAPELDGVAGSIRVVDLDDLKHWYRRRMADMARILETSKQVIEAHRDMYEKLIDSFQGGNPA